MLISVDCYRRFGTT